jgi:hypothetical protein
MRHRVQPRKRTGRTAGPSSVKKPTLCLVNGAYRGARTEFRGTAGPGIPVWGTLYSALSLDECDTVISASALLSSELSPLGSSMLRTPATTSLLSGA